MLNMLNDQIYVKKCQVRESRGESKQQCHTSTNLIFPPVDDIDYVSFSNVLKVLPTSVMVSGTFSFSEIPFDHVYLD